MSEPRVVSVSTLVNYLKSSLEQNPYLRGVFVEGEISNMRRPYSGHWYFSLKDKNSSISCVMFAGNNRYVHFPVNDGDKFIAKGDISVYTNQGQLQLIVQELEPSGVGQLYLQFEALKKKLNAEGLFDSIHKKPLPEFPMDIGLITGNNTAAREDVLITLQKRWPVAKIHEYPAPVQGPTAAPEIIKALKKADAHNHDVLLLVRGGGSIEDLWCFNNEALARTVFSLQTPIVTGVGHETDTTLVDYVSDFRANTPTGAVEAACPDLQEVLATLQSYRSSMIQSMKARIRNERTILDHVISSSIFTRPERLYSQPTLQLQNLQDKLLNVVKVKEVEIVNLLSSERNTLLHSMQMRLMNEKNHLSHYKTSAVFINPNRLYIAQQLQLKQQKQLFTLKLKEKIKEMEGNIQVSKKSLIQTMETSITNKETSFQQIVKLLDAYSPLKVMERGYSVSMKDNEVITSVEQLDIDDNIQIRYATGKAHATITKLEEQ